MTPGQQRTAILIACAIERYHCATVQRMSFADVGDGIFLITRITLLPRSAA